MEDKDITSVNEKEVNENTNSRIIKYDAERRATRTETSKKDKWKNIVTIIASGFALISDGYVNGSMSMLNKVFVMEYGKKNYR